MYYIWFDRVSDGVIGCNGLLQWIADSRYKKVENHCSMQICCFKKHLIWYELRKKVLYPGLWSRKSRHPTSTPTPGNFDYPTPTPDRLRPSAVLVT